MERLRNPREFSFVYNKGTPCFGRHVVVSQVPTGRSVSRVGFAVSKKLGSAVTRNRVKRRLKAIMQELADHISPGYDVVIGAKRSSVGASFAELKEDLRLTLQKCSLIAGRSASSARSGEGHA
ncbi:MAG TPA: ribonuclease P protein component [Firmicutes bacterium]|nr:ribonuclease P protein component [Bacillota bacterium]